VNDRLNSSVGNVDKSNPLFWIVLAFGVAAVSFHLGMIELANLPNNALSLKFSPIVARYVHPLFVQNWNFFAPTPIDASVTVYARAQTCTGRSCTVTPWYDISDPLIDSERQNRFSSVAMIQLMLSNAAIEYKNKLSGLHNFGSRDWYRDTHGPLCQDDLVPAPRES